MVTLLPHVRSGKIRALGVSSVRRVDTLPDVPTIAESGLPGFEAGTWYGIVAPARTPSAIVEKLNRELVRIISLPDVQERLIALGLTPNPTTTSDFRALIESDTQKHAAIVKAAGMKAE
jgi:tripartite-type tricarboxylate transporter receptor subunit TctC